MYHRRVSRRVDHTRLALAAPGKLAQAAYNRAFSTPSSETTTARWRRIVRRLAFGAA
jgi:hypothetical protein